MTSIGALIEIAKEIHNDARAFNDYDYRDLEWMHAHYPTLLGALERTLEALEYYAHPDHYEAVYSFMGERPAGVLTDGGRKARTLLQELKK